MTYAKYPYKTSLDKRLAEISKQDLYTSLYKSLQGSWQDLGKRPLYKIPSQNLLRGL